LLPAAPCRCPADQAAPAAAAARPLAALQLCRQLQAAGWRVVALCRRSSPELEALGVAQIEEGVDVGSDDCVALLRQRLAGVPVGLLICNAGVLSVDSVADLDIAVCREQVRACVFLCVIWDADMGGLLLLAGMHDSMPANAATPLFHTPHPPERSLLGPTTSTHLPAV
jgi:NAD(P)-dependent dehydrogenase (short-subunit alcohol dehydrogenase family)